jgi:PAS domain S-box-containing protein
MAQRPPDGETAIPLMNRPNILKSLAFRISAPVVVFILLAGSGLYAFSHFVAADFVARIIKSNLEERAGDIYSIVDTNLDELIKSGLSGDEKAVRIRKVLTLSVIQDEMRQKDLLGGVLRDHTELFMDEPARKILSAATGTIAENVVTPVTYRGEGYYAYLFEYEPWNWRIFLIKKESEFASVINKVWLAYIITGAALLLASLLFVFYLGKTFDAPLNTILVLLKRGEKPVYKGIYEFELLSDTIGTILESLQDETQKLNNIYHIALSKRGKDFFDEIVAAIARMFDLNSFIAKVNPDGETIHIISMHPTGLLKKDTDVPLASTPCKDVIRDKRLVVIEAGVSTQYPLAQLLAEMGADSYACVPILDRRGKVTGIVNVFGKHRKFTDADLKVLQTIGQMAAAEFEMLEKTILLDNILHSSTDTAIIATDLDFRITYYNPAAETMFKHTAVEVTGQKLTEIPGLDGGDPVSFKRGIDLVKSKGEHRYTYKTRQEGETHHIDAKIYGMRDEHKKPDGFVLMARDITDYKHLEEQLLHSQKLEAVGLLAGGVAHEFNNILTAIMGYGSLLQGKFERGDPYNSYVDSIVRSSRKAANLTQGLLAFSRKQIINPKPVPVNDIVRKVEELLVRVIGEDIELKTVLTNADLMVTVDSGQIEQVLMNLATNARDAMPTGGVLTIETEPVTLDDAYVKGHLDTRRGRYALISLSDTGTGMDEKTKEHIFEPFFTSKEVGKGTGLGLSIVFGIIKQHNGDIVVYSEPGKGTVFKIYLPLSRGLEAEQSEPIPLPSPKGGDETILMSEDNEQVRHLVKTVLQDAGYTVIAADSEDAVRIYEKNRESVRLLLLDVVMPKKSGKAVYDDIKKIQPDIKALFMSGYTASVINKSGVLDAGIDFIAKPISPDELLRKVRKVLDQ